MSTAPYRRSTLCVRHVQEGLVYHLVLDGDLHKVTGALIKQYVYHIAGIPVDEQHLWLGDVAVQDSITGAQLGLQDGAVLLLYRTPPMNSVNMSSITTSRDLASDPVPSPGLMRTDLPVSDNMVHTPSQRTSPLLMHRPGPLQERPMGLLGMETGSNAHSITHYSNVSSLARVNLSSKDVLPIECPSVRETPSYHGVSPSAQQHAGGSLGLNQSDYRSGEPARSLAEVNRRAEQQMVAAASLTTPASVDMLQHSIGKERISGRSSFEPSLGHSVQDLNRVYRRMIDEQEKISNKRSHVWHMESMRFQAEYEKRIRQLREQQEGLSYEAEQLDWEKEMLLRQTSLERRRREELHRVMREAARVEEDIIELAKRSSGYYHSAVGHGLHLPPR